MERTLIKNTATLKEDKYIPKCIQRIYLLPLLFVKSFVLTRLYTTFNFTCCHVSNSVILAKFCKEIVSYLYACIV